MPADEASAQQIDYISDNDAAKARNREWAILCGLCLAIAVVLRLVRIGYRDFFGGEFLTLRILRGEQPKQFLAGALDGSVSMYHTLLSGWASVVGSTSEAMLRVPSAIFEIIACVVFFLFARTYLRGTALAICMLAFAMNPILVGAAIDATPFALLSLFAVTAHFFAVRALDRGGALNWSVYAAAVAGGLATHPLYFFVVPAHLLFALLRGRRTPKAFRIVSVAGLVALAGLAVAAAAYAQQVFPRAVNVQTPSSSDLVKSLVGLVMGNFSRYDSVDPNEFVRGVMYFFVLLCLVLSVQYYRKRTAEAMAMPENVMWIDETQDVVGRWNRLSLRAFLLFQWFAFVIPVLGIFALCAFAPSLRMQPEMFIPVLPALIVLMAMGIDAAPKEGALALGVLLLLAMLYYDVRVLRDRGYGVRPVFEIVRKQGFNPDKDIIVYTEPDEIGKSIQLYRGTLPATPVPGFKTRAEFEARQALIGELSAGRERVFAIYHEDRKNLGKTEERSPLREWFSESETNRFEAVENWKNISAEELTELRMYRRLTAGQEPAE